MVSLIIVICVMLIEAGLVIGFMYFGIAKRRLDVRRTLDGLKKQLDDKKQLLTKVEGLYAQMVDVSELKKAGRDLKNARETLKTERGRITITQAELETVEGRLRELEEISRELEASGLETKEEVNILKKKERELTHKNQTLKEEIATSVAQINQLMAKLEMTVQVQEQVEGMKADLIRTQERIDTLLLEIEQGNEQYFILKRRYDALDIEYAQLFEKFSEAEAAAGRAPPE